MEAMQSLLEVEYVFAKSLEMCDILNRGHMPFSPS